MGRYGGQRGCGCSGECGQCQANFGLGLFEGEELPRSDSLHGAALSGPFASGSADSPGHRPLAIPHHESSAESGLRERKDEESDSADLSSPVVFESARMALPELDVDIFFSAGPRDGSAASFGCTALVMSEPGASPVCRIYRVRLTHLAFGATLASVRRVTNVSGEASPGDTFQPVLNPDGARLAYVRRRGADRIRGERHGIVVRDLNTGDRVLVEEYPRRGGMQFPSWYGEYELIWERVARRFENAYQGGAPADTPGAEFNQIRGAIVDSSLFAIPVGGLIGPGTPYTKRAALDGQGQDGLEAAFEDPDRKPITGRAERTDRVVVMMSNVRTLTEEVPDGSGGTETIHQLTRAVPIVAALRGDSSGTVWYERFNLGRDSNNREVETCHHPAWSITGEVMCHAASASSQDSPVLRPEFVYEKASYASVTWGPGGSTSATESAQMAYPVAPIADMEAQMSGAFAHAGLGPSGLEPTYHGFKYGKFSPDGDYVVTTYYAGRGATKTDEARFLSRVLLIRRSDGRFWDLTQLVEVFEGASSGSWSAFAPSCAGAS